MRGMPFQYKGQGVLEISAFASICSEQENWKQKKKKHQEQELSGSCNNEPTSVLHMRRSPSPPTSASTLSSSFPSAGGGASAEKTAVGVAELHPIPAANELRKDEWVTELQQIPSGLEVITGGGGERCGLGLEDWESMLSESAASPSQEHPLLRWISGDIDDASFGLKQLLQSGNNVPLDFEGNAGLGIVDQGFPGGSAIFPSSGAGISTGTIDNGNGKMGVPSSSSGVLNYKVSSTGLNNNNNNFNLQTPVFPVSLPSGMIFQQFESPDEKPQILNSEMGINQNPQNPNLFLPLAYNPHEQQHLLQPQPKRHNSSCQIPSVPFSDPGHEFLLRRHNQQQPHHMGFPPPGLQFLPQQLEQKPFTKSKIMEEIGNQQQQQQHALLDQLYKAAELVGTGNFQHAQGILARLNHQLSPVGKPLHRAAFYFKEALQLLILMHQHNPVNSPPPRTPTPLDVIFKMGAYKVFSEVSPIIHFVNFTCNQALLEALDDADRIHIVDFDIGFGVQWASFMQELPVRNRGVPSLKITAFASPSTHHPVELALMRENLTQFANEIGVNFELQVINFDSLDQNAYSLPIFRTENEAIAVNFPIWSSSNQPAVLPSLLRIVKQLSPKIVVSLDRGCDRSDLPFPQHILHALQSYINLLESLDAVNLTTDAVNKIERFLLQPRIESTVLGRLRAPDKMPIWKTLFASAGFSPLKFSNFTETQAECVVKRTPVRGFHVEKRQASLVLCWQRRELISASAWKC